jgi:hypothetical protein
MITFLLDQNVNKKTLARSCNDQGLAIAKRFPVEWKNYPGGFKDPELLRIVMAGAEPLLTNDREIAAAHTDAIPNSNPGIIIVGHPPRHIRPMGRGELEKIIARFKEAFTIWHHVSWSKTIAEITPISVEIKHIEHGILKNDELISRSDVTWPNKLENWLKLNSARSFP